MSRKSKADLDLPDIPAMARLKRDQKWVAWKFVERDGRTTKPPVNPHTGRFAKNNAPSDWGSYEQALARAYADGLAGLGYVLTADDGLTGADLDKVRDPVTGELDDWAAEIVGLGETYCEVSPSGRGLRLFWEGKVERAVKSDKHSVEIYGTGRYLTITGNRVEDCPDEIRPAPRTEAALRARVSGKPDDGDLPEHLRGYKSQGIGVDIGPEPLSRWQELNAEALARLDDWVPAVFGDKARKQASGGYRVSSKDLGRDLEEDLSLTPEGIKDFGVADQGDERQGKRSPIDVVMEHTEAKDLDAAFAWLSQKLGRKPDAKERTDADVTPTPYAWIDPAKVPRRSWLYAPHYVRQFVSLTVSTGGVGKSSLIVVEALAMASGRPLLKLKAEGPFRVWYWNGEDPMEELQRRFAAAARHHGLRAEDLGDRLFVDSGRDLPIVIAEDNRRTGTWVDEDLIEKIVTAARANQIDVIIVDPFVTTHRVNENDNAAVERVAKSWSKIAEAANCSIMLVHHSRKTGGEAATVDDGRGASALLAAARTARSLNTMTAQEAKLAEVDEHLRRLHFRSDLGKTNLSRPAEAAYWFKLVSVDLGNGPFGESDEVGVVTAWQYPAQQEIKVQAADVRRALDRVRAGGPWRENQQSKVEPWVGVPIAGGLGIDLGRPPAKRQVSRLVLDWIGRGWLRRVEKRDGRHKPRDYVEAGDDPVG